MAVNVNQIYTTVATLAKKSQHGYQDSISFNNDLNEANLTLYNYYVKIFEETQQILDSLLPFVKEVNLPLTQNAVSATTPFPSDYFHRLEIGVNKVTNQDCGEQPLVQVYPCDYLLTSEEKYTLSSSIRRPSIAKNIYRHTFKNALIHIYPKQSSGIIFKYLRKPLRPVWGSTLVSNLNGDFEQYDPATSVQSEFPEQETPNMVSLMLFYLGEEIRETPLIQFAKEKMVTP